MKHLIVQHRKWFCGVWECINLKISLPIYNIYIYYRMRENPVFSHVLMDLVQRKTSEKLGKS